MLIAHEDADVAGRTVSYSDTKHKGTCNVSTIQKAGMVPPTIGASNKEGCLWIIHKMFWVWENRVKRGQVE